MGKLEIGSVDVLSRSNRTDLILTGLTAAVIAIALTFGGATRQGSLGDFTGQLIGLALLSLLIWTGRAAPHRLKLGRIGWTVFLSLPAICLIQLIPGLPGASLESVDPAITAEQPRAAWTYSSTSTAVAASSLFVPLAIFVAVASLGFRSRLALIGVVAALGAVSLVLGFVQVAQGPDSPLRLYSITNPSEAVGFFANRNHFAALLACLMVLAGTWFAQCISRDSRAPKLRNIVSVEAVLSFTAVIAIMLGMALARSRAGILLTFLVIVGVAIIALSTHKQQRAAASRLPSLDGSLRIIVVGMACALLVAAQLGLQRLATRFTGDPLEDLRVALASTTIDGIVAAFPFGTGVGSFVPVYATLENVDDLLSAYANRAHNDWLEFPLEGGVLAIVAMALFVVWYVARVYDRSARNRQQSELRLQRSAALIILVLMVHSLVDYPLRTGALSAIFAMACGLLLVPPGTANERRDDPKSNPSGHEKRPAPPKTPRRAFVPAKPSRATGSAAWPEAWQTPDESS
ncbi:MAG: O-antigen ligase family protein [Pseudomonadota bacterium]